MDENLLANINRVFDEVLDIRYSLEARPFAQIESRMVEWIVHCAMNEMKSAGGKTAAEIAEELLAQLHAEVCIDTHTELRLLLSKSESEAPLEVSPRDVGTGISQLLPVVVNALALRQHLIAIEQPELHLHPALQAELGDVFIESALGENKNNFLIETHSEHLILRLLRRIRETAAGELPVGKTPLRPEDIAVLYVKPGSEGSEVIALPVNTEGDFDAPWPDGFFAERSKELF